MEKGGETSGERSPAHGGGAERQACAELAEQGPVRCVRGDERETRAGSAPAAVCDRAAAGRPPYRLRLLTAEEKETTECERQTGQGGRRHRNGSASG